MKKASLSLLLILLVFSSCSKQVDLLVHNAIVYTANKDFDKATAFVVKNGRFLEVVGSVAQLVEQWTENPCVAGSIPARATQQEFSLP